ncbi:Protein FAM161A [Heterocephalus glaber]|uniref:Protein FAM161A n=1 Tax=Heterocephalus glaber TaxID=10181 RepID=G5B1L9_HETGA|nr:Protein FAM161A [Heterocephalus glaber]
MAAEKDYSNKLTALGISDKFVSKKRKSGKVFEYFSNQEMKSFAQDKENFDEEEKVEERENGEENCFIDSKSQDSCKDKDEDDAEVEKNLLKNRTASAGPPLCALAAACSSCI